MVQYKITGDNLQLVTLEVEPGEKIYAEAGSMAYMSGNIHMNAKARGGIKKGIGRMFMGETFFMTEFTSEGGKGMAAFGGSCPGTIKDIEISSSREFMVQKDAFLVAEDSIELSVGFQKKLGSIFFGGEGFILQRLSGSGTAFIHACGDFVEFDLVEGQTLKVETGCVVGWDSTVKFDIQRVKGVKTMFFGGEGLFLTTLTGPGKVILQSMNLATLAGALAPFMPNQTSGNNSGGNIAGSVIRGVLKG